MDVDSVLALKNIQYPISSHNIIAIKYGLLTKREVNQIMIDLVLDQ